MSGLSAAASDFNRFTVKVSTVKKGDSFIKDISGSHQKGFRTGRE
jgi:hypothetical protein